MTGWGFGLTREDRSPRPALQVAAQWNQRTVRDLEFNWPSISVVICAHNAADTLDECLRHTCALDYADLEILVVDDGSSDSTPEIAMKHPGVRLVQIDHSGLAAARNAGFEAATGELVAYLDSDAFPTPEWPYYLALAFDAPDVGGAGGPNIPPYDEPPGAEVVARAPGGPVQVLFSDDRAEHVPGCNMAFWRLVLSEIGGFDPVYTKAGDDVDVCWKILNRDWEIGFHPAALVWHRRRKGLRNYLRQQREYGRSEALVEDRHPERFTPAGTARWRGRIYNSLTPSFMWQRIYRGPYGTAAYQSVYQGGGHFVDLVHQVGIPGAVMLLLTAPLARDLALAGAARGVRPAGPPAARGAWTWRGPSRRAAAGRVESGSGRTSPRTTCCSRWCASGGATATATAQAVTSAPTSGCPRESAACAAASSWCPRTGLARNWRRPWSARCGRAVSALCRRVAGRTTTRGFCCRRSPTASCKRAVTRRGSCRSESACARGCGDRPSPSRWPWPLPWSTPSLE